MTDSNSGASFLVDTGSSYSIIPHSSHQPPTGPLLRSANGQRISCWGEQRLTVTFSGHRYTWAFLLVEVQFNILGVDFLQHFRLLVYVAANSLQPALSTAAAAVPATATTALLQSPTSLPTVEALELPFVNSTAAVNPQAASNTAGVPPKLTKAEADILQDFSDVLNAEGRLPPSTHGGGSIT